MLARARHEPDALVIGIDAAADRMAESSRRAAAPVRKGGLPNALFAVAAAERLPAELTEIAGEVTVFFPWGSLLHAVLALDDACEAAAGITGLVEPGGTVRMLVSIDPRDRLALAPLAAAERAAIARRWAAHGLTLTVLEPADPAAIAATGSSWGRRLQTGRDRLVWRIELRRTPGPDRLSRQTAAGGAWPSAS